MMGFSDDDTYYLPDDQAREFYVYLRAGYTWDKIPVKPKQSARVDQTFVKRSKTTVVRQEMYDGSAYIVGYVLEFYDPDLAEFGWPTVILDVYGNELNRYGTSREGAISEISPIDFIGPGLVSSGARTAGGFLADTAPAAGELLTGAARGAGQFLARTGRTTAFVSATMRGLSEIPALAMEETGSAFVLREGAQFAGGARAAQTFRATARETGQLAGGVRATEAAGAASREASQIAQVERTGGAATTATRDRGFFGQFRPVEAPTGSFFKGAQSVSTSAATQAAAGAVSAKGPTSASARGSQSASSTATTGARGSTAQTLGADQRTTEEVFREISSELGLEVPGTIRYRSTADAARAATASGLANANRPGFQTHSTSATVRRAVNAAGQQSAHIVPQAVYRALRRLHLLPPNTSEGRALTTLLPRGAHRAFDSSWIADWRAAVAAGRPVTAGDVYQWLTRAINAVNNSIIDTATKGAIIDRIHTELFVELGLTTNTIIVP
jgi:hypothetical protein